MSHSILKTVSWWCQWLRPRQRAKLKGIVIKDIITAVCYFSFVLEEVLTLKLLETSPRRPVKSGNVDFSILYLSDNFIFIYEWFLICIAFLTSIMWEKFGRTICTCKSTFKLPKHKCIMIKCWRTVTFFPFRFLFVIPLAKMFKGVELNFFLLIFLRANYRYEEIYLRRLRDDYRIKHQSKYVKTMLFINNFNTPPN